MRQELGKRLRSLHAPAVTAFRIPSQVLGALRTEARDTVDLGQAWDCHPGVKFYTGRWWRRWSCGQRTRRGRRCRQASLFNIEQWDSRSEGGSVSEPYRIRIHLVVSAVVNLQPIDLPPKLSIPETLPAAVNAKATHCLILCSEPHHSVRRPSPSSLRMEQRRMIIERSIICEAQAREHDEDDAAAKRHCSTLNSGIRSRRRISFRTIQDTYPPDRRRLGVLARGQRSPYEFLNHTGEGVSRTAHEIRLLPVPACLTAGLQVESVD